MITLENGILHSPLQAVTKRHWKDSSHGFYHGKLASLLQEAFREVVDATLDTRSTLAVFEFWAEAIPAAGCHHTHLLVVSCSLENSASVMQC